MQYSQSKRAGTRQLIALASCVTATLLVAGPTDASPSGPSEAFKFYSASPDPDDNFGAYLAVDGDTVLVGAAKSDELGENCGSAEVYRWDAAAVTWMHEQTLLPPDGAAGDYFGQPLGLDGDVAAISACLHDDQGEDAGALYVFRRTSAGWQFEQKLLPADGASGDEFGRGHIAIDGDRIIAGAHHDDDNGVDSGTAYIFRYEPTSGNWVEEVKLHASDGASGDNFGYASDICGNVAIVGAPKHGAGALYVYRFDGFDWIEEAKLVPSFAALSAYFGWSASIDRNVIIAGAWRDDDLGNASGSAFVFRHGADGWSEEAKLLAFDGEAGDIFGDFVTVSGDTVAVGAHHDHIDGVDAGSAYLYHYDPFEHAWKLLEKLTASDGSDGDIFGADVALRDDMVLISARLDDDHGHNAGSVYVFDIGEDCGGDLNNDGVIDATDLFDLLSGWGPCP